MNKIPMVALRGLTVLPDMIIHFDLSRKKSIEAVVSALTGDQKIFLVAQKNPEQENPTKDTLYEVGTIAIVKQVTKLPNNIERVLVEGVKRARLIDVQDEEGVYYSADLEILEDINNIDASQEEAYTRSLLDVFEAYVKFYPKIGKTIGRYIKEKTKLTFLADQIAINTPFTYEQKQQLLETIDLEKRVTLLITMLMNEAHIASIRSDIAVKVKESIDKNQKDYILREQLSVIRKELGDNDSMAEADQYAEEAGKLVATDEVKEKIEKQILRYRKIAGSSQEAAVERTYIETLLEMPWDKTSEETIDLERSQEILDRDHYGLDKVKERIIEYLAVREMTKDKGIMDAPIICLVGPPGTGKTSIAKSIAESLSREYVRICLGGIRDEAEIRGHRRTYIGAMPGRIANGLKTAKVANPLMLLDEIDKVSSDYKGDTSSALLEVLDPEQNCHFRDHYLEIPLDLSKVLFIATANDASNIPRPLLDRMEIIEVTSYTSNEKFHIAKEHLVAKQLKKNGLDKKQISISDAALRDIIAYYTREAGVRNLERTIGTVCRKAVKKILDGEVTSVKVSGQNLEDFLGKRKYRQDKANKKDDVGIVRGLAWTSVGGDTLEIEVNVMPGKGEVTLTGQMGDVMKESATTGISYIRSIAENYNIKPEYFKEHDFHIHIPEGAVPKDGPSAGITMATAVLSAITDIPVSCKVAMTGEITLRGRVLAIGGLKEKMLAAKMAGITTILVPIDNEKDVAEIPEEIKSDMEICYMSTMDDVLEKAFVKNKRRTTNGNKKR